MPVEVRIGNARDDGSCNACTRREGVVWIYRFGHLEVRLCNVCRIEARAKDDAKERRYRDQARRIGVTDGRTAIDDYGGE